MAISQTKVIDEVFTANSNTYTTTATLTSVANRLYIGASGNRATTLRTFTSATHNAGTNPLTFVKVGDRTYNTIATPLSRLVSYRAMKANASNAGTVTVLWSGTVSCCFIAISEFDGVDTSGTDGSGAILQGTVNNAGDSVNTLNTVLAALGNSNNRCWSAASTNKVCTFTPDANYTEIVDSSPGGSEVFAEDTQWDAGTGDLTCTHTPSTTANNMGAIAHEIVAAAAVPSGSGFPFMLALLGVGS